MPLYEFNCNCGKKFTSFKTFNERNEPAICPFCLNIGERILSVPNIVTDTSFGYTGKVDARLGKRPISGRADWKRRVAAKGYKELDSRDLKNLIDKPDKPPLRNPFD